LGSAACTAARQASISARSPSSKRGACSGGPATPWVVPPAATPTRAPPPRSQPRGGAGREATVMPAWGRPGWGVAPPGGGERGRPWLALADLLAAEDARARQHEALLRRRRRQRGEPGIDERIDRPLLLGGRALGGAHAPPEVLVDELGLRVVGEARLAQAATRL